MTAEPSVGPGTHCAVLGFPVAHSLSPALHRAAYAELGLAGWTYDRREVTADGLRAYVEGLDDSWRGFSLTMPLKSAVLGLGEVDPVAELAGAGNTLLLHGGRRTVHNTDVPGLVWAVREAVDRALTVVTVLGTGATARSTLVSAAQLGARRVQVVGRDAGRAAALAPLAERLGLELVALAWGSPPPPADLLVSTVTAGAADAGAEALVATAPVVFDVVYDPWPTALAAAASRAGCQVVDGLALLVGQAVLQVELMTGHRPSPEVLRAAGLAALHRSAPAQDVEVAS